MPQIMGKALNLIKTIKSGDPVLNLDRSIAAETLWPAALGKESDKAAIILRSFFVDGFIVPYRTLGTCPHQGVDVADIVIIANDEKGLDLLSSPNGMLGNELNVEPGPIPESDAYAAQQRTAPRRKDVALYYVKSKGHLAEMDLKHMVIREANDENERFYGVPGVSAKEILSGQTKTSSSASDQLYSTLTALDKQIQSLSGLPTSGKCPGDCRVRAPATANP